MRVLRPIYHFSDFSFGISFLSTSVSDRRITLDSNDSDVFDSDPLLLLATSDLYTDMSNSDLDRFSFIFYKKMKKFTVKN
jgi:hypothetical protein